MGGPQLLAPAVGWCAVHDGALRAPTAVLYTMGPFGPPLLCCIRWGPSGPHHTWRHAAPPHHTLRLTHSTHTLHSHTTLTHSTHTLHSHTPTHTLHSMPRHAMPRHATPCHATPCHVTHPHTPHT